jgi:hypothetical protein
MFLSKLFRRKPNTRWGWVLVDLFIVIIGVYCAFLIQTWSEEQKNQREADKVYSALKYELETFRYRMAQVQLGMNQYLGELQPRIGAGNYPDLHNYRFIQPQYDYKITEYALQLNSDIIDFELYDALQKVFAEVKRLEYTEELLTETARSFKTLPPIDGKNPEIALLRATNNDHFNRFRFYIRERRDFCGRVAKAASTALPLLNTRLGQDQSKKIETDLVYNNLHLANSEQEAIQLVQYYFPHFTEDEIRALFQKYQDENSNTNEQNE